MKLKEDRLLGLFLMQSLCSSGSRVRVVEETRRVDVYKAVVASVGHPPVDLWSSVSRLCGLSFLRSAILHSGKLLEQG